MSFLSKHDKEIDTSIKDSPQIYDYKDFKVYTDNEITEASLYLKQKDGFGVLMTMQKMV